MMNATHNECFLAAQKPENPDNSTSIHFYQTAVLVTGVYIYPILTVFGIFGNVVSIVIILRCKLVTTTHILMVALLANDSVKLANDFLYFVWSLFGFFDVPVDVFFARVYPYSHFVSQCTACNTAWLTVSIAVERFLMVCKPTKARKIYTVKCAKVNLSSVFLFCTVFCLPILLRYKDLKCGNRFHLVLGTIWSQNPNFVHVYVWALNIIRALLPLTVLFYLNLRIIHSLYNMRMQKRIFCRHRITIMLLVVTCIFVVSVLPDAVLSTAFNFGYNEEGDYFRRGIREITDTFLAFNSACNFPLFYLFNTLFKKQFIHQCVPSWCCGKTETTEIKVESSANDGKVYCMVRINRPESDGRSDDSQMAAAAGRLAEIIGQCRCNDLFREMESSNVRHGSDSSADAVAMPRSSVTCVCGSKMRRLGDYVS